MVQVAPVVGASPRVTTQVATVDLLAPRVTVQVAPVDICIHVFGVGLGWFGLGRVAKA